MRPGRLELSAIEKREIWSRWKAGETLHEIGRVYGKCHNTIRAALSRQRNQQGSERPET
jgi:IS30 family transposase